MILYFKGVGLYHFNSCFPLSLGQAHYLHEIHYLYTWIISNMYNLILLQWLIQIRLYWNTRVGSSSDDHRCGNRSVYYKDGKFFLLPRNEKQD